MFFALLARYSTEKNRTYTIYLRSREGSNAISCEMGVVIKFFGNCSHNLAKMVISEK
jgi:hypothetical protein